MGHRANRSGCQVFFTHSRLFFRLKLLFCYRLHGRHLDAECLNLSNTMGTLKDYREKIGQRWLEYQVYFDFARSFEPKLFIRELG